MSVSSFDQDSVVILEGELDSVVKIFKALADNTRVRIISILTTPNRYAVSELADILEMDISRVSHQLTKLEDMGFIKGTRDGRNIYYELQDECIRTILRNAKDHVGGK
ncbi:MAG: ArsR/SmtB family transcription factor [Candidatus Thorarchaeota archaeon]